MNKLVISSKKKQSQEPKTITKYVEGELVVSTLDMCDGLNVEHRALIQLIKKYENHFQDIRVFTFEMLKPTSKNGGRPIDYCYLDEEQAAFLITLMKNSEYVVPFKLKLTKEFYKMRRFISK